MAHETNEIENQSLHAFYDAVRLVTRGSLFSPRRWVVAAGLGLGAYNHYLKEYLEEYDAKPTTPDALPPMQSRNSDEDADCSSKPKGGYTWHLPCAQAGVRFSNRGVIVRLPGVEHAKRLELDLSPGQYSLAFWHGGAVAGRMPLTSAGARKSVSAPPEVFAAGYRSGVHSLLAGDEAGPVVLSAQGVTRHGFSRPCTTGAAVTVEVHWGEHAPYRTPPPRRGGSLDRLRRRRRVLVVLRSGHEASARAPCRNGRHPDVRREGRLHVDGTLLRLPMAERPAPLERGDARRGGHRESAEQRGRRGPAHHRRAAQGLSNGAGGLVSLHGRPRAENRHRYDSRLAFLANPARRRAEKDRPRWASSIPTIAETIVEGAYVPSSVLGVSMVPGFTVEPKHQYAFVVLMSANDKKGKPLGVAPSLAAALAGGAIPWPSSTPPFRLPLPRPESTWPRWSPATVFTTGDVVTDLHDLSSQVFAKYAPLAIKNVAVDSHVLDSNARFCELQAEITYPQFQTGTPPYDKGGLFVLDSSGLPMKQGELTVPLTITLPKNAMPHGGYPLVVYFHGTGGRSTDIADRGTWRPEKTTADCPLGVPLDTWNGVTGCTTPGEGPGWVLAPHGFAMAASALPLNPQRWPAGRTSPFPEYININNVAATRDIFRQGVLEERMFFDALRALTIDPSVGRGVHRALAADGRDRVPLPDDPLLSDGQSMGAMYANIISAVEPRIKAVLPTGPGATGASSSFRRRPSRTSRGTSRSCSESRATTRTCIRSCTSRRWGSSPSTRSSTCPASVGAPAGPSGAPGVRAARQGRLLLPDRCAGRVALAYGNKEAGKIVMADHADDPGARGARRDRPVPGHEGREVAHRVAYTGVVVEYTAMASTIRTPSTPARLR